MVWQVAVCGPADCGEHDRRNADRIGELLARAGAVVICGGGGGVMAAAAAGARRAGGLVIGVCPDDSRPDTGSDLSAVLVTNLGQARNAVIVWSADAVVVVGGSWGTLSEQALALRRGGVPVVTLGGWQVLDAAGRPVDGPAAAASPEHAVELLLAHRR